MAYCTKQDMIDRFSQDEIIKLTDRDNVGVINDTVLNLAIDDAGAEIDGYLSKYTLPLANVPEVLVRNCCDIARYFLYDDAVPEQVEKRYEMVQKFLINVAKGVISLGLDSAGAIPEPNDGAVVESGGRIFERSENNGFL